MRVSCSVLLGDPDPLYSKTIQKKNQKNNKNTSYNINYI